MIFAVAALAAQASRAAADIQVYADALGSGWQDWSWSTSVSLTASSPVHGGTRSLSAQYTAAWAGLYLSDAAGTIPASQVDHIEFWANGGAAGAQHVTFTVYSAPGTPAGSISLTLTANTWVKTSVLLSAVGSPAQISGLVWQDANGATQPVYYLDDITIVEVVTPPPPPPTMTVNVTAGRHAISPYIYGMNFAEESLADALHLPVRRFGGNATTRYNWQLDVSNHAFDWYFENIPEDTPNVALLPNGSVADLFVEQDRRTSTKTIITTPLIGWTPKDRNYRGGFSITKYGAQTGFDPYRTDIGNGISQASGNPITGNDPLDTSFAITPQFTKDWIAHLASRYGTAAGGGVMFYALDNEPELWSSTHRDVRPQHLGYDEERNLAYSYGAAIKQQDPTALTLGPCAYGYTAYFYSDLDTAPGGSWWNNPADRLAHGNAEFVAWYLAQMQAYQTANGVRVLDYFDLHYYPDAPGVTLSGAGSAATQALRLRSTRSLWDATYNDESWIGAPVRLIPRMKDWVNNNYPGTKLSLSEYNWGALDDINGAVAQADVLGIFGREAIDLATLWDPPTASEPGAFAFRMYLNYNGTYGKFGETSVQSASTDQSQLAIYGAQKTADNALTLMVVNKATSSLASTITISNFTSGANAQVFRYSSANLSAIVQLANTAVTSGVISATFPAQSITLFVVPSGGAGIEEWERY